MAPRPSRTSRRRRTDRGYATAEAAVTLPVLLVLLAVAVGVLSCVAAQLRCVDAARAAARVVARGDTDAAARSAAHSLAPAGSRTEVQHHAGTVEVVVSAELRPFGRVLRLPAVHVGARAVAEQEGR